jgi:tetratricopeptide (TPR) repeat protein
LLALSRSAHDDRAGAEVAYREALRAGDPGPRVAPLAAFARQFDVEVTIPSVFGALRWMYEQASDHQNRERIATEELALPAADRAAALRARAIARTFLERHEEAMADYRAAMEAGDPDDQGLLRFNLACELALAGRKDEAIASLKQAISCHAEWAEKARKDSYFRALWEDTDFVLAVSGLSAPPSQAEIERWISRSLGHSMNGQGERSIEEAERAVAGALLLQDRALQARALGQLGSAQTYGGDLSRAIHALERAEHIAREVFAHEPVQLARTLHFKGAALHAGQRFAEAESTYQETLALREQVLGKVSFEVAIVLGDLGRLASDQQRFDEALALQTRCREALEGTLPTLSGDPRLDVLLNLALNEGNRASVALDAARGAPEVLAHSEAMAGFLEQLVEGGGSFGSQTIPRLRRVLSSLVAGALPPELTARVGALAERLLALETPDPAARAEKLYWAALRAGIHELVSKGADEREIAAGIARAVRGQEPGEPVSSHPAFRNLAAELSARLNARGDLVMIAMSLDLAVSGAQPVAEAIGGLESFALANLAG